MTLFDYSDYREYLRDLSSARAAQRGFQTLLAKAAGCQASYLSQALKGQVHLTEDQALGIAEFLELTPHQAEHLLLMVRFSKAATPRLRGYLKKSLERSTAQESNLGTQVQADHILYDEKELGKYLSTWIPTAIHMLTSSADFQTVPEIAKRLRISESTVIATLEFLEKTGFVENTKDRWIHNGRIIHVPKDSPWQSLMQSSRRQLALRSIEENPPDSLHFSSVFTVSKEDFLKIQKMLRSFIEKSHDVIHKSDTQELCGMCLDLFVVL